MNRLTHVRFLIIRIIFIMLGSALLFGCGSRELPLERLKKQLKDIPSYSIILEDMKEEGNFSKHYFHKYRVVMQEDSGTTDWIEVPENYYKINESFLGMSLAAKKEGEEISTVAPPGYQYVGDSRYGRWREDNRGGSFWEFYGKYALFSSLLGGWYRPIYRNDYAAYQQYRARNVPYFGRNSEFGTSGSVAKQNKPNFFARRAAKQRMSKSSFSNRVSKRVGRTRTGYRGRAGGFGK